MHIQLEAKSPNAIEAYSDDRIQINSIVYENSVIVSREEIISNLAINNIKDINEEYLGLLMKLGPEVVILGHKSLGVFPPSHILAPLYQNRIGVECMALDAACRTFNVLLSEGRRVVGGFIF